MSGQEHNRLLWIFFTVQAALQLFSGLLVFFIYGGMGAMLLATGPDEEAAVVGGVFLVLSVVIGVLILATTFFYGFTAFKMKKMAPVGRILGIIASCFCLLGFPLGTALGVYGLWFFFGEASKEVYGNGSDPLPRSAPPPPPHNWQ